MDAMNVGKLSAKKVILLSINDAILERNHMGVFHVDRSSTRNHSSLDIKDVTWERNHISALNVRKPFLRNHTSVSIREVMQARNLIHVMHVGKCSLSNSRSLLMRKFMLERNLQNTVRAGRTVVKRQISPNAREFTQESPCECRERTFYIHFGLCKFQETYPDEKSCTCSGYRKIICYQCSLIFQKGHMNELKSFLEKINPIIHHTEMKPLSTTNVLGRSS